MKRRGVVILTLLAFISACAPLVRAPGEAVTEPKITDKGFLTADGEMLPLRTWGPENGGAKAVIIALHGFNDYSNFFAEPGAYLAKHGIRSYAYDQRGFGRAPGQGLWPGVDAFSDDLKSFSGLVRRRHPGTPVYLLGESMGGAVIMVAATGPNPPEADAVILAAPAVWGRITMPWYQRLGLWIGVRIMPGVTMTGQGLNITPSDNIEMLKALGRDPLVLKATRVDAMYGLTNLMDKALDSSSHFGTPALIMPVLIMYGQKDEIIPKKPTRIMLDRLPTAAPRRRRVAVYENGYHMLLRDLKAKTLWRDIVHWIGDKETPLPSGADVDAETRLAGKSLVEKSK